MSIAIDYFLSPQSPWTYLGHERFAEIAANKASHTGRFLKRTLNGGDDTKRRKEAA